MVAKIFAKPSAALAKEKALELPDSAVDDLTKLMQELKIMTAIVNDIPKIAAKVVANHSMTAAKAGPKRK